MWINVRSIDGRLNVKLNDLSKLCKIEKLRLQLVKPFDTPPERQQLYYRGKELVDGHTLHDYSVGLNDVIQMQIKPEIIPEKTDSNSGYESSGSTIEIETEDADTEDEVKRHSSAVEEEEECSCSNYYKVGDFIDAKEEASGSWYEAKIVKIVKRNLPDEGFHETLHQSQNFSSKNGPLGETYSLDMDKEFAYYVIYDGFEDDPPAKIKFANVRSRSYKIIKVDEVKVGDVLMANYNMEEPNERGYWFDVCTTKVDLKKRTTKDIVATILIGAENTPVENCSLCHLDDLFKIETPVELSKRSAEMEKRMQIQPPPKRQYKPSCRSCNDNPRRKCRECACAVCGKKDNPEKQILCDECNVAYHIWCLKTPLDAIPTEDWYCPDCKINTDEVVKAGEKLKMSKKKAKMPSNTTTCSRDWGKGMACMGRTKVCTIVPSNHFGAIPNVSVGTLWKFRMQVAEAGIHRPSVGGIHGRAHEGAYSIVLSGGYEDDMDNGDEFTYTGSGGRDLTGNKRTSGQAFDQKLEKNNLAIARNCNAKVDVNGAEAKDWRAGKPVRVVRNYKGAKHSKYSPESGNRYDGLYKVVKYWPETGKSGHLVWRYLFRRDDPDPAPWTKEGKKLTESRGLTMQYPEGYTEGVDLDATDNEIKEPKNTKRKSDANMCQLSNKKRKESNLVPVPDELLKLIKKDKLNKKLWDDCLEIVDTGLTEFRKKVEDVFICICCQDVVCIPVTTECFHNFCRECIQRSFSADVYSCPACRNDLRKIKSQLPLNECLRKILQNLLQGYENGR